MILPETIRQRFPDEPYQLDGIGESGASVLLFRDQVLKVQECGGESENERRMMEWLQGRVPVPRVLAHEEFDGRSYLLMSKCGGEMACARTYMADQALSTRLLAAGLKMLWDVDVTDCPSDQTLKNKLVQAARNVECGLVDMDHVEPDTFGEDGFRDPEELLQWLMYNQPEEDLVLSHGDYCLPNVFFAGDKVTGFIDLGKTGVADRWCDIALFYRSLRHNYRGKYSGENSGSCGGEAGGFDETLLFRELGVEADWEKIHYYILLDELF